MNNKNKKKKEIKQEQRKKLIDALIHGKIEAAESIRKEITGKKIIIHNFLEHLQFSSWEGSEDEGFEVEIAPGEYRDFLLKLNTDEQGELKPSPVWSIPVDSLTDAEIELYMEQDSGKLL